MVGRALQFARGFVYAAGAALQCGAGEDVVDAQSHVAAERHHAVIPPGVVFFRLLE